MKTGCGDREFYLLTKRYISPKLKPKHFQCVVYRITRQDAQTQDKKKTPISHLLQIPEVLYKGS